MDGWSLMAQRVRGRSPYSIFLAISGVLSLGITNAALVALPSSASDNQLTESWALATAETQLLPPGPGLFLPEFPTFNSGLLDQQLQLYANFLWSHGPPDVMIVGSSRALQGVDPGVLQETLAQQGYPHLQVYNFSINGATAQVVDLMLRRLLAPEQLPRLVIWADGSRAFNSGRTDITYNGIAASEGYRQLAGGDRPIPSLPPFGIYADDADPCLPAMHLVTEHPLPLPCLPPPVTSGWQAPVNRPLVASASRTQVLRLDDQGFNAVAEQYNPNTYYQRFPRVAGRYDSNYATFQLGGVQAEATLNLARYLQNRQIPLMFVNLPLHRDYIDSFRQAREQQFQRYMAQLAAQGGFTFRDLSQQWNTQHRYFADPSHLNAQGARAVAQYLVGDRAIPWHRLGGTLSDGQAPPRP